MSEVSSNICKCTVYFIGMPNDLSRIAHDEADNPGTRSSSTRPGPDFSVLKELSK